VGTILGKIDDAITFKEVDKKRKPFAVSKTLSMCMKNSIASVLRPDPKADDYLLEAEEAVEEPVAASKDNYSGEQKVKPNLKVNDPEMLLDIISQKVTPEPSLASKVRVSVLRKALPHEADSVSVISKSKVTPR
jgi:hypothetical protein